MKVTNIFKITAIVALSLLLSTSMFAQDKPATPQEKPAAASEKHECTEACKTDGCSAEKMKKHVCTEECKTAGCDAVKAKECKSAKAKECKDKDGEAKTKECKDGKDGAMYECPMKCEPASHKSGECSKCGMELKKVEKE
ncbi:MAG: hypothetical protein L3J41_09445 [Melioribacteraceae bacterium]|nr:hypothetical protein [Melioribacteraceae bacterium]